MDDSSLKGKAKELYVASLLTHHGFYVYWPLVDRGYDLICTNKDAKKSLAVQVKYQAKGGSLDLRKAHCRRFSGRSVLLAYVVGEGSDAHLWFIPFEEWQQKAEDRKRDDGLICLNINRNKQWLSQFEFPGCISRLQEFFAADMMLHKSRQVACLRKRHESRRTVQIRKRT